MSASLIYTGKSLSMAINVSIVVSVSTELGSGSGRVERTPLCDQSHDSTLPSTPNSYLSITAVMFIVNGSSHNIEPLQIFYGH